MELDTNNMATQHWAHSHVQPVLPHFVVLATINFDNCIQTSNH